MNYLKASLVLGVLGVAALFGGVRSLESDVLVLEDSDFDSKITSLTNDGSVALVMFYAPWCGHCKKLKPEFDKVAPELLENDPKIVLVKVDCTEGGKDTCSKFSVQGYPTLKIFKGVDQHTEYNGPRDAAGIAKYMKSQVGAASKELKSTSDFNAFIEKSDVAVVAFLATDSKLQKTFEKVSDKLREKVRFGHVNVAAVVKDAKQKEDTVVLYRPKQLANKFEPDFVVYDGAFDKDDIEKFINTEYHGKVGIRTSDSAKDFKAPLVIAYFNVDYKKNPKGTNYWRNRILKVSQSFAKDFTFAVSSKDEFQHEMNEYGIDYSPSDKPIITVKNAQNQKFIQKDEFSIDGTTAFLKQVLAGEVEPFLKSEPIPDSNDGPVVVAVAKNFDEVVLNNDKDVLIEFYAPWCGHCKKLVPVYDELGHKLKGENVAIVKMDATANDVPPQFDVRGFPTLFWVPKDNKSKPQRYEGGREVNDFISYIAKHATEELNGYDREGKSKKSEL